jgi:hypothetical protein
MCTKVAFIAFEKLMDSIVPYFLIQIGEQLQATKKTTCPNTVTMKKI